RRPHRLRWCVASSCAGGGRRGSVVGAGSWGVLHVGEKKNAEGEPSAYVKNPKLTEQTTGARSPSATARRRHPKAQTARPPRSGLVQPVIMRSARSQCRERRSQEAAGRS